jgi:hypothetical protein
MRERDKAIDNLTMCDSPEIPQFRQALLHPVY